jgi:Bacterial EndoU nuclease
MDPTSIRKALEMAKARECLRRLEDAGHWMDLNRAAQGILGPYSFGLGVCAGIVENPVGGLVSLMALEKTFILADLHDRLTKPLSRTSFVGLGAFVQLGAGLMIALGIINATDLERAAKQRDKIKEELAEIFAHPLNYLASLPTKIKDDYVAKWDRFRMLNGKSDLKSQFEAGEILGDVLMGVAMTIAGGISGVGAAARLASKVPELTKVAGLIRKTGAPRAIAEGTTAREAAAGGKAATKAAPEPPPSGPPPKAGEAAGKEGPRAPTSVATSKKASPATEQKILYGKRKTKPDGTATNELIGAHSPAVKNDPNFAVEESRRNPDGTTDVKLTKQFPDGNLAKLKNSTLAPDTWSDAKILKTANDVADTAPVMTRAADGATLHRATVDGVQWEVIKDGGGEIVSSYPTGGTPTTKF